MSPPAWLHDAAVRAPTWAIVDGPGVRQELRDDWIGVTRPAEPEPSRNEVVFSRLGPDADAVIDRTFAHYAAVPTGFKWSVPAGSTPDDLGDRLRSRGMRSWWARAMVCRTDEGGTSEAVDVSGDPDRYALTSTTVWGTPELRARLRADLQVGVATGRFGLFVTTDGGSDVGAASVVAAPDPPCGYLMGAAVLPDHRGRGHYAALMSARLRWLRDRNIEWAVTLAREATSAPILERRGFSTLFRYEVFQYDLAE